ncbi:MAG: peroxiredoxin family protein [Acidimicrobiales bacterium]
MAPELCISEWFNTDDAISLADLEGEVVVIEAFQMLCPGCVSHGIPQAQRIQQVFGRDLTLLGLHSVFEHHAAMTPVSLAAFLHEYRVSFPVGVDSQQESSHIPMTMSRYGLRGTPSLILIDRSGMVRLNAFGQHDDLVIGAAIARLLDEPDNEEVGQEVGHEVCTPPDGGTGKDRDPASGCAV